MHDDHLHAGARFMLASFGELLSEPSRAAIVLSLMDGSMRPASELADIAGVARSTASSHLSQLVTGGILHGEQRGKHRYYRLASERVADALEAFTLLLPDRRSSVRAENSGRKALAEARTCYTHLAGRLGVAWLGALQQKRVVALSADGVTVTDHGSKVLQTIGLTPRTATWPRGKLCLDWTERHYHLGGPLGSQLTEQLFRLKWIARRSEGRSVRVTTRGEQALAQRFDLALPR